jgi:hypothetical protein
VEIKSPLIRWVPMSICSRRSKGEAEAEALRQPREFPRYGAQDRAVASRLEALATIEIRHNQEIARRVLRAPGQTSVYAPSDLGSSGRCG